MIACHILCDECTYKFADKEGNVLYCKLPQPQLTNFSTIENIRFLPDRMFYRVILVLLESFQVWSRLRNQRKKREERSKNWSLTPRNNRAEQSEVYPESGMEAGVGAGASTCGLSGHRGPARKPGPCSNLEENKLPRDRPGSSRRFQMVDLLRDDMARFRTLVLDSIGLGINIGLSVAGPLGLALSEIPSANHFLVLETVFSFSWMNGTFR
ncbi:hypothetical protein DY000_02053632 [Brassica cretica]|uniref:Uncharacterized protein n=1 Tax=Brassica cretica TaxID=69181 RepID=A0ABQ7ALC8_BRACR|nr:hypothetical protein DY000_02053632 [Brassica cretica]